MNRQPILIDDRSLSFSNLDFFIYPFAHTETADIIVNPKTEDNCFGFKLLDNNLTGRNYIKEVEDTVGSSAACAFGTIHSNGYVSSLVQKLGFL